MAQTLLENRVEGRAAVTATRIIGSVTLEATWLIEIWWSRKTLILS